MTTPTTIDVHAPTRPTSAETIPTRRVAVVIALLFLGATATFLTGDALVVQALDGPRVDTGGLTLGVALQALNAVAVAGLGVAFLRVLPSHVRRLALGHLVLRIVEAVVIVGIGGWMIATESLVDYEPVVYVFTGSAGPPDRRARAHRPGRAPARAPRHRGVRGDPVRTPAAAAHDDVAGQRPRTAPVRPRRALRALPPPRPLGPRVPRAEQRPSTPPRLTVATRTTPTHRSTP